MESNEGMQSQQFKILKEHALKILEVLTKLTQSLGNTVQRLCCSWMFYYR